MKRYILSIIISAVCCLVLGRRLGYLSAEFNNTRFTLLANAVKRLFILTRDAYFGNGLWKYIPTRTYTEFVQTENLIYDIISEIVDESIGRGEFEVETEDIQSIYHSSKSY